MTLPPTNLAMQENKDFNKENILELVKNAKHIAIVPSKIAGPDSFCAGAALYYMLRSAEKQVSFIYPGVIPEICNDLLPEEVIDSNTSHRKLSISVDYSDTPAARVEYSNDDNILKLLVSPIARNFNLDRVKAEIAGFDFDLVFMLGVQSLGDLGKTYTDLKAEFDKAKIINIDNTKMNTKFGHANILDVSADNLSMALFRLAPKLDLVPDIKAAKAILLGMTYREPDVLG